MLVAAAVNQVARKINDVVGVAQGEVKLWCGFSDDLETIKDTLVYLEGLLKNAENNSFGSERANLRYWLGQIKSLAYDIEDTVDGYYSSKEQFEWSSYAQKINLRQKLTSASHVAGHKSEESKFTKPNSTGEIVQVIPGHQLARVIFVSFFVLCVQFKSTICIRLLFRIQMSQQLSIQCLMVKQQVSNLRRKAKNLMCWQKMARFLKIKHSRHKHWYKCMKQLLPKEALRTATMEHISSLCSVMAQIKGLWYSKPTEDSKIWSLGHTVRLN